MIRFFANLQNISKNEIRLNAEDAAHIRSLRLRPSEHFVVCDGEGMDHICRLCEHDGGVPTAGILETRPSRGEPTVRCSVYIAYSKGERLDYAVQKSVELGAYEIILFPSERCVAIPKDISKKTERLQRIVLETAKQSGRGRVPEVTSADSFGNAADRAAAADLPLFFYECEERLHLKQVLEQKEELLSAKDRNLTISIMTGPEGGFDEYEAQYAKEKSMHLVTLGPRILRCETAPAAALAVIMYHTGNL